MVIRMPDYYEQFRCLAGDCPRTCCEKWEVVIDEETACRYFDVPGSLGDKLRACLQYDTEGDFCFPLNGGRCPFLDNENLCEIHRTLGEDATSVTCREHPRFTEDYGPFREITLSASCPAANALLLGTEAPLTFLEQETGEPEEAGDEWLAYLLPLRNRMLSLLTDRRRPLRLRLAEFLRLADEAQLCLEEEQEIRLPTLAETWRPAGAGSQTEESLLFPRGLRFLGMLESLDGDWPELLRQAETAASVPQPETLLERIAVYFAFRYLLKAVNDGDFLSRAKFCVFSVLTVEKLSAVCGLPEALRKFSCEIEHSDENLDALLDALAGEACFSLVQFLAAIEGA